MWMLYFETNHRNGLIYILIHMKLKSNRMLFFNLRNWITFASLIFNRVWKKIIDVISNFFAICVKYYSIDDLRKKKSAWILVICIH